MPQAREDTDVVIVGSRCAGAAAAIALARRGRRVIALDSAGFPSDTMSTHLFFPHHFAEVERLGALPRVDALGAPRHTQAAVHGADTLVQGPYGPVDGIAYGSCVRRPGLDLALVETAREAGAEMRERTRATALTRDASGRVTGVEWRAREAGGPEGTIAARLVVGADGRHSSVARWAGAETHHEWPNHRLMAFAYYRDPREADRHIATQWRLGRELATVFPCDGGLTLVLLMSPADRAEEYRSDPAGTFEQTVAGLPLLSARLEGCERETKIRISYRHPAYFRCSSGAGWALAGDAGHFKDPVIAQGIRDALRFGRLLGEAAAPVLDDPDALDRALRAWEDDRDAQCLAAYQWGNGLGLDDEVSPLEATAYRWLAARPGGATEVLDVFSRRRDPLEVFSVRRVLTWAVLAARDPRIEGSALRHTLARDVRREAARVSEQLGFRRRRARARAAVAVIER